MTWKKGQSGNPKGRPKQPPPAPWVAPAYVPAVLYPKQYDAIFCPERYAVIEASTKSGKTYGCMDWLVQKALAGEEGQAFWWIAPSYFQTKIAWRRYKRLLPKGMFKAVEAPDPMIRLSNGAELWFKTGDNPDLLYGEDVFAAVLDEDCRIREEAWHAIRSTLTATRGPVRLIGNVRGKKNWAYMLARQAEAGKANYHYAKLTAWDAVEAGVLDKDEVEDAKATLPAVVFKELYEAEATDDGSNPFDIRAIKDCTIPALADGPATCMGWDLAKYVDWTVGIGLNREREVCVFERFQAPWGIQISRIQEATGRVPALVDATGVGDPIVEELQRHGGNYEGFKFTTQSKQQIMEGLALAIQQRKIRFPEGPIVSELLEFEFQYTRQGVRYSAPEGLNDDCVCGLALANAHYSEGGARVRFID
jgi:hypothetical protein